MKVKKCLECGNRLAGKQTMFCSIPCKNSFNNSRYQNYEAQQARGRKRKRVLVRRLGGCCEKCGYATNYSALHFHHVGKKRLKLDLRHLSNCSWKRIVSEAKKCRLLCANCHAELHHPNMKAKKKR